MNNNYNNVSICCNSHASFWDLGKEASFARYESKADDHYLCMYFCKECYPLPRDVRPSQYYSGFKHYVFIDELLEKAADFRAVRALKECGVAGNDVTGIVKGFLLG
jgi:hypothetical protein